MSVLGVVGPEALPDRWLFILITVVSLLGCSMPDTVESVLVMQDIAAGTSDEKTLLKRLRPSVLREEVRFRGPDTSYVGDIYRSGDTIGAAIVLVPGAVPSGKNDPRLVAFATTLARASFLVLVPDIANLRALRVRPQDADAIADAVNELRDRLLSLPGSTAGEISVGIGAFSYAVGPAVLAALRLDIRAEVEFILAIGGYYDLVQAITYITTGHYRVGDRWQYRPAEAHGRWVFLASNLDRLAPVERPALAELIGRRQEDPEADVADLVGRLGAQGQAVYALVDSRDPQLVPGLIAALPIAVRHDIEALDLSRQDLTALRAQVLLIHGRDDPLIPYTESVAFAHALGSDRASLYVLSGLSHVDVDPGAIDLWLWWRATREVLMQRRTAGS